MFLLASYLAEVYIFGKYISSIEMQPLDLHVEVHDSGAHGLAEVQPLRLHVEVHDTGGGGGN